MPDLIKKVEENILSRKLLKRGDTIVVAVSGGIDSMVLLNMLCRLRKTHGWKIHVAHLNHKLRGKESDADEKLVRRTARANGLKPIVERVDIAQAARERKVSIEMAARAERHEFLARIALKAKARVIVLAHHADDQVELFFLRLFRGTGVEGLAGMKWKSPSPANKNIQLIRPLLNVTKRDLLAYAAEHGVKFRDDATNRSLGIKRNRIRHELLPLIQKHYQQGIGINVTRLSDILRAESEFIGGAARDWLKKREPGFSKLNLALQRRVLQLQLIEKGVAPDFDLIEKLRLVPDEEVAVRLPSNLTSKSTLLVSRAQNGDVKLRTSGLHSFSNSRMQVRLNAKPAKVDFTGLSVRWQIQPHASGHLPRFKPGCEWFDASTVGEVIILRHWSPGDRFQPIGMQKPIKLQDIFVNRKIPREERGQLAVATTASGEIFWVEKLRISERFKLCSATKSRLKWSWLRR